MKLTPLSDRVLIRPTDADEMSAGGILIPENARRKTNRGVVEAVGRGKRLDSGYIAEPQVKPGDTVLFERHAGYEIEIGGTKLFVMNEGSIIGVLGG